MGPFLDAARLHETLDEVVLVDTRWYLDGRSGRAAYRSGHLPGAVFADLDVDLTDPPSRRAGRHPLPDPERFAAAMSRLGISDADRVVAYDDVGGAVAARLVWMLRVLGEEAAVLDGGLDAWDGALETREVLPPPGTFTARPWPDAAVADADEVARLAAGEGIVIDARAPDRYRGEREPVDPRAGHVPGAINRPYEDNLRDGRLLDRPSLWTRFAVAEGRDTAVYCGSGVTACHDVLVLEHLGLPARLYPGSWSAWSGDPDRPAATGDAP